MRSQWMLMKSHLEQEYWQVYISIIVIWVNKVEMKVPVLKSAYTTLVISL